MADIFDIIRTKRMVRRDTSLMLVPFFKAAVNSNISQYAEVIDLQFKNVSIHHANMLTQKEFYKAATRQLKSEAWIVYKEITSDNDKHEFRRMYDSLLLYLIWVSEQIACRNKIDAGDVKEKLSCVLCNYK